MKRIATYILLLILVVISVGFSCLNAQRVQIDYYLDTATMPLSLLLTLTFATGGVIALLFSLKILLASKRQQRHLTQQLRALQNKDSV